MLKIGDIEIYIINDADTRVDGGGAFGLVPRALWSKYMPYDDNNLIDMAQNCLFVRADGKNIVVDTGMGERLTKVQQRIWHIQRMGGLRRGLATLGVQPEDIDLVINTHLHSDHCGGNTLWQDEKEGTVRPTFPNAEYVVQRREYDDAMQPNERTRATYILENYATLVESGQMRLLEGDTELASGVRVVVTPGHTPAHMSVIFEDKGESAIFLCDMATYMVHFERLAWMTAYDVEPLVTLETKRIWQKWALENDATLFSVHDPIRQVGKLEAGEGNRVRVVPIETEVIAI
jgi:glyoxylase-like metal-dependent hydrolase (beta-lactamase superfamily II)